MNGAETWLVASSALRRATAEISGLSNPKAAKRLGERTFARLRRKRGGHVFLTGRRSGLLGFPMSPRLEKRFEMGGLACFRWVGCRAPFQEKPNLRLGLSRWFRS